MSQQALGDAMRELGHKWSQATVWSVEKGERPLRFAEAADLAAQLDVRMDDLYSEVGALEAALLLRKYYKAESVYVNAIRGLADVQQEMLGLVDHSEHGDRNLEDRVTTLLGHLANRSRLQNLLEQTTFDFDSRNHVGHDDRDYADEHAQYLSDLQRGK